MDRARSHSVAAEISKTPVINVTPLTDLIVRAWFKTNRTTADEAFTSSEPFAYSTFGIDLISATLLRTLEPWRLHDELIPNDFNPISTPFAADGIDPLFDLIEVDGVAGTVAISSEKLQQRIELEYSTRRVQSGIQTDSLRQKRFDNEALPHGRTDYDNRSGGYWRSLRAGR